MSTDPSLAIIAMTQSIAAYTTFLPPLTTIRQHSPDDPSFRADVRVGQVAAAGLTLGVGAMISSLTGSATPAMISAVTALGMFMLYEFTLRSDPGPAYPTGVAR